MSLKPGPTPKDAEQSKRFIEAARQAQADEKENGAERAFKKVAGKRPGKRSPK
jgi:hypothetical protein